MTQHTILKSFFILSISLLILIAGASCDENNNIFDGGGADNGDEPLNGDDMLDGDDGVPSPTPAPTAKPTLNFTGIGIDYDPEARCSENDWSMGPVACNPQVGFTCPATGKTLDNCPTMCQSCYDSDLNTISGLGVGAITIYQPNYYILKAAEGQSIKVILGLFNDQVNSLSSRHCSNDMSMMCAADSDCGAGNTCMDDSSGCTFSGFPALCGTGQAKSILDGACGSTTPWSADMFCAGAGNTYITPNADFISGGTVIGIQIGNEVLTSGGFTKAEVVNAAKVLRNELDTRSMDISDIPIIVSLVVGKEQEFCENGAPPKGVNYIAAHPYCNQVASSPPSWPFETGNTPKMAASACWTQVKSLFEDNAQMFCGADNTYIGETGYNTGCPMSSGESTHLEVAPHFIDDAVSWTCMQSIGTFLFAFVDACPMGGCLAGCSGESIFGNGYFGLYFTDGYDTMGALTAKYDPLPTLTCQ